MATILLADDSEDLRTTYALCLRSVGHGVIEAGDGRMAIDSVKKHQPDLLLLDIWMPNLNGFEVLYALRDEPAAAQLKVAMLSVMGDADSQLESFGAGAIEYLVKGLSISEFLTRVEAILARPGIAAVASDPS